MVRYRVRAEPRSNAVLSELPTENIHRTAAAQPHILAKSKALAKPPPDRKIIPVEPVCVFRIWARVALQSQSSQSPTEETWLVSGPTSNQLLSVGDAPEERF